MDALSNPSIERARKAHAAVLQSMQEPGTARNVAQVLGVSESTISRTKGEIGDVLTLCYQLGFKLVPQSMTCYPDEYMRALHTLAQLQVKDGPKLEWD